MKDFSKCRCDKPGFCPLFDKEMGTKPPNWQWCQESNEKERKKHFESTSKRLRSFRKALSSSQVEVVEFVDELPERTSDYAVCVIPANDLAMELLDVTRDSIKSYAEKCGADYIELSGDQHPDWPMANKYRLHNVSSVYEKTLYLDCDIKVMEHSPNIFDMTPDDKISMYEEMEIWERRKSTKWIKAEQEFIALKFLEPKYRDNVLDNGAFVLSKMFNGGVMVIPKALADWYKQPDKDYPRQWCFDQNYLTLTMPADLHHQLDVKFNYNWQIMDFTNEHQYADFINRARTCYFMHVNGEKNADLRKKILGWDFSDRTGNSLLLHESVSMYSRWNGCDTSFNNQTKINKDIYEYVDSQPKERKYSIDDVAIGCIGHKQEQFDKIKKRDYLTNIYINEVKTGKFSDNVWAETRVWDSNKKFFPDSKKIIGWTTASWPMKYSSQMIDDFHLWAATDILLKSEPEDKIWICADMYCSCLWLRNRVEHGKPFYGVIGDCLGEEKAKSMLKSFLKMVGLGSRSMMHRPVPFSNQMIGHRENIEAYEKWLIENDVFEKVQYVLERWGFSENQWDYRGTSDKKHGGKWEGRCFSFRPQAYLMEATNCFWCAHQDYKYIASTHRFNHWYDTQIRTDRGW